jgi:dinuclear metal center YbgI/SA1388 family protein
MATLADMIGAVEEWFDPRWAEPWDAVGLTCGDPAVDVNRVLLAVDVTPQIVAEAEAAGVQLLLTHHPLLFTAVHGVPATDPKGAMVHRMIRAGIAHYVAHTNADVAVPGVSDALAQRLGITGLRPLEAAADDAPQTLVAFLTTDDATPVVQALVAAGATWVWRTIGVGVTPAQPPEQVAETRIELAVPPGALPAIVATLGGAPFHVQQQLAVSAARGVGRVGELPESMTLRDFIERAARLLPATEWGVRAAGDPSRQVRTVAVCGGSGAAHIAAAHRCGADAYLTADLKHHATLEAVTERGMALVDAGHWATEAPWLDVVASRLRQRFGTTVNVTVSPTVTDPWTLHIPSPEASSQQ